MALCNKCLSLGGTTLPERVLHLQTDKEMYVLQVGFDLLKAGQDAVVSGVGVLRSG